MWAAAANSGGGGNERVSFRTLVMLRIGWRGHGWLPFEGGTVIVWGKVRDKRRSAERQAVQGDGSTNTDTRDGISLVRYTRCVALRKSDSLAW